MASHPKAKPSKTFGVPGVVGLATISSRALRAGKNQIAEANEYAQSIGCGSPFRADNGYFEADRNTTKRFIQEGNKRRDDLGEPRVVNFDGGYGDVT